MPDVDLLAAVSRSLLGLPDLDINDHDSYYVAPASLGAQLTYTRQQVSSPWVDGQITVNRSKQNVMEPFIVEVLADTYLDLFDRTKTLIAAFTQDSFLLKMQVNNMGNWWRCEAADYQIGHWVSGRLASVQGQVVLTVPRQPVARAGVG